MERNPSLRNMVYVVSHKGRWAVITDNENDLRLCEDKNDAILLATCLAAEVDNEVVVHDEEGFVQQRFAIA